MESKQTTSDMWQCLAVIAIWLVAGFVAGLLGAFLVPSHIPGFYLGLCGASIHLILWALERTPHWSYAGLVFGSITTCSFFLLNLGEGMRDIDPIAVLFTFLALSFSSYMIYPIATLALKARP